ncbi:hypothetical protein OZ410_04135 [Robiginitalea sp. M366]|uniref:DUF6747 family protein n=1 Tax=Robiginitalea aestuariiviva TaxID=3036903 RepID=UPI00240D2150|nr:DUF6747 family protein [Robiginitalea aestuariiviva]MDG1571492.1 hypothetical protein [Robiginitalea aestuariiviva]
MENRIEAPPSLLASLGSKFRYLIKRHFRILSWLCFGIWLLTMYALLHVLSAGF